MRAPQYAVAAGNACVPPNELARVTKAHTGFVVIGSGKTGLDTVIWLLENGVDPDKNPLDQAARLLVAESRAPTSRVTSSSRAWLKASPTGSKRSAGGVSVDDVFARLEAFDEIRRIDRSVKPTGFHGGFVSDGEMERLRRVRNVVRLGRVTRIDTDQIVLERGAVPTSRDFLHVDCSAPGIPALPAKSIFDGDRITLQWVRMLQPTFSWSLIGHAVEATYWYVTKRTASARRSRRLTSQRIGCA